MCGCWRGVHNRTTSSIATRTTPPRRNLPANPRLYTGGSTALADRIRNGAQISLCYVCLWHALHMTCTHGRTTCRHPPHACAKPRPHLYTNSGQDVSGWGGGSGVSAQEWVKASAEFSSRGTQLSATRPRLIKSWVRNCLTCNFANLQYPTGVNASGGNVVAVATPSLPHKGRGHGHSKRPLRSSRARPSGDGRQRGKGSPHESHVWRAPHLWSCR